MSEQGSSLSQKEQSGKGGFVKTRAGEEANKLIASSYDLGWEHARAGKPVAWVMYGPPREIMQNFDVLDIYPESYCANCAIKKETEPYISYAEEEGFSENICGYLRQTMGYARSLMRGESTEKAAFGGMPKPTMLLSASRICDPRTKVFETLRRYLEIPAFIYDHQIPPTEDPRCIDEKTAEHYIEHNLEGFKGLVKFLEDQTGRKLDRERLSEMVRNSIEAWHLFYECFELRKKRPCPMGWEDHMVIWRPFRDIAGEKSTVQFYRDLLAELRERVKQGISVAQPEEKYRLLWLGLPMWFDTDLLNYLESQGAVVVADSMFHTYKPHDIDTSDPLRALAEKEYWSWDIYGRTDGSQPRAGLITGSHILDMVREYHVDGVISHTVISCRATSIGNKHMSRVLREDYGIPVLNVESHMSNLNAYSPTETRERADTFINLLEARK